MIESGKGPAGRVTAVVLTKNEELHLGDCLRSLQWCDRVLVLDSLSTDRTVEIARQLGAEVVLRPFKNFADQRNAALDMVDSEWVLFVDADERVTPDLASEIRAAISDDAIVGWKIPTHNFLRGHLVSHGGFYPDYHIRLFRSARGRYDVTKIVHEQVILEGEIGTLRNPLIHISCDSWSEFMEHQDRWATFKAQGQFARGIRPTYHLILGPLVEFVRRFVYYRGFQDGLYGLIYSLIFSYYVFVMYARAWRLWRQEVGRA